MLICVGAYVITCAAFIKILRKKKKPQPVDQLKNALLSFAFIKLCPINNYNMNYDELDGTALPMFSGYNIENACFTYIMDQNNLLFSKFMQNKARAIDRYILKNINSEDRAFDYFSRFISEIYKNEVTSSSTEEYDEDF